MKSWGLKREDMVEFCSPCKCNLVTSWWLVHLPTLFMVDSHLGNLIFIVIYTNLGLFADLCVFLCLLLKAHVFALDWFKIDLDTLLYYLKLKPFSYLLFKTILSLYLLIKWVIIVNYWLQWSGSASLVDCSSLTMFRTFIRGKSNQILSIII